jgi:hypothetical protein
MPSPTAEIQSFGTPTVKAGVLTQPITLAGEVHGFSAPAAKWRDVAWSILSMTEVAKPRPQPVENARPPAKKPNGRLL